MKPDHDWSRDQHHAFGALSRLAPCQLPDVLAKYSACITEQERPGLAEAVGRSILDAWGEYELTVKRRASITAELKVEGLEDFQRKITKARDAFSDFRCGSEK